MQRETRLRPSPDRGRAAPAPVSTRGHQGSAEPAERGGRAACPWVHLRGHPSCRRGCWGRAACTLRGCHVSVLRLQSLTRRSPVPTVLRAALGGSLPGPRGVPGSPDGSGAPRPDAPRTSRWAHGAPTAPGNRGHTSERCRPAAGQQRSHGCSGRVGSGHGLGGPRRKAARRPVQRLQATGPSVLTARPRRVRDMQGPVGRRRDARKAGAQGDPAGRRAGRRADAGLACGC